MCLFRIPLLCQVDDKSGFAKLIFELVQILLIIWIKHSFSVLMILENNYFVCTVPTKVADGLPENCMCIDEWVGRGAKLFFQPDFEEHMFLYTHPET